jgi:hypothetical protein
VDVGVKPEAPSRLIVPIRRRDFVRVGAGLAAGGMILGSPWGARTSRADGAAAGSFGRARSCILVYLLGGPPHLDTFDLKPEAPEEVRGPFQAIDTNVPGTRICEHLPRLATMADQYALLRSVSHPNSNHTPMIYYTLTGRETDQPLLDNDIRPPQRADFPHIGSVVTHIRPSQSALPGYVAIPELAIRSSTEGEFKRARTALRGGAAGILGPQFDPLCVNGTPGAADAVPAISLPEDVWLERFEARREFLSRLDQNDPGRAARGFDAARERAITLTGSANQGSQSLFSVEAEPVEIHERYGRHRFGQAMLLARRLVEADVPVVAIHFNEMTVCDGWDTHSNNFTGLETELLPYLDQGLSALIGDLKDRSLLDSTAVACFGEFGRTPKINANAGRDHWGDCSTTLLAGAGVHGGLVLGESDKIGAYPKSNPINPVDVHATLLHLMGIDAEHIIYDMQHRPYRASNGQVVSALFA